MPTVFTYIIIRLFIRWRVGRRGVGWFRVIRFWIVRVLSQGDDGQSGDDEQLQKMKLQKMSPQFSSLA